MYRLLEEQKRTIIAALHREASQLWIKVQTFRRAREDENKAAISYLNATIKEMWPFAEVRPFGSFASGLYSLSR
jgi:DNA polymerase sigma